MSVVVVAVSAMTVMCVSLSNGPRPKPIPAPRDVDAVRVVASGRDPGRRSVACPSAGVSSAVETVCGFDRKTAMRFPVRIAALRSICNRRDLPSEDVDALLGYVAATNDAMRADRVAGLKNEVLNLLRRQDPIPETLVQLLTDMIGSGEYDDTITDYCIQHLGSMWSDFANEGVRENVRKVFVSVAERKDVPYAGTALYALADDDRAPDEYRRKLRRLTAELACDPSANRLARITAIQIAGNHGFTEVLPSVRNTLSEASPDVVLAMVSVGAVGCLGGASDILVLEEMRGRCGVRLRPAVDAAIRKLQ